MKNKNQTPVIIILILILFLVFIITALAFIFKSRYQVIPVVNPVVTSKVETVVTVCDPYSKMESLIKTSNLQGCDCLKDETEKVSCRSTIVNYTLFSKAINEANSSQCTDISVPEMKATCLKLVEETSAVLFKNKNLSATSTNTN